MRLRMLFISYLILGSTAMADSTVSVAMVFRENDNGIDIAKLRNNLENAFESKIVDGLKEERGTIVFELGGYRLVIGRMPVGIPQPELESAAGNSLLFKDVKTAIEKQKAHIILSVLADDQDKIRNRIYLIKLVRSVILSTSVLGVYWGDASQLIQPDIFLSFTEKCDTDNLPIPIWISICKYKTEKNKINVHSIGLKVLGCYEYEIIDLQMKWSDAYYFLLNFAGYMISSGDEIKDGDTIGRDENEKLKVKYIQSEITEDEKVMRIFM